MKSVRRQQARAGGFSLLELLLVMGVTGILAGVSLSGLQGLRRWQAASETRALLAGLETACRLHQLQQGAWPEALLDGEAALSGNEQLKRELAPYMEQPLEGVEVADGYGNTDLRMLVDLDGDHWLETAEFKSLSPEDRPERLWARVAVYSMDGNGRRVASSWENRP